MAGRDPICCLVLLLALTSVSAVQKLNSINHLKKVNFGSSVPTHSLVLLHWFANTIEIDNNNIIQLTFEPNTGDYGAHHYGNYEGLLEPLPRGRVKYRYYTLGNLNSMNDQNTAMALPSYMTRRLTNVSGNEERNRDRIIFRVREENTIAGWQATQIDEVYITQHYGSGQGQGTSYDPAHTYRITTNLLRELRQFSVGENQRYTLQELTEQFDSNIDYSQLHDLQRKWGDIACLGLLLFIVITEQLNVSNKRSSAVPPSNSGQRSFRGNTQPLKLAVNIPANTQNHLAVDIPETMGISEQVTLEVKTGDRGKARIHWNNIPEHLLDEVMVVLFENNNNRVFKSVVDSASGSCDTSTPLNTGLQVRLHKVRKVCFFWTVMGKEICRGTEYQNPAERLVAIRGYNASLQLFVKDGKACARLYVRRTFTDWEMLFSKSWIGFYSSAMKATDDYETWKWQWAIKFTRCPHLEGLSGYVYEYCSGMAIARGVQARFILSGAEELARTPAWE